MKSVGKKEIRKIGKIQSENKKERKKQSRCVFEREKETKKKNNDGKKKARKKRKEEDKNCTIKREIRKGQAEKKEKMKEIYINK